MLIRVKQSEVAQGSGKVVVAGDRHYAVFHVDGAYYAMDNACPHRGAPLGEGEMDGAIVICPWHRWEFDVTTGASPVNSSVCVKTYPCRTEGGEIVFDV